MKVIYVAGPYRAPSIHGILENIRQAEALAIEVWRLGHVALCPHMNSAFFDGLVPDQVFMDGTLELLKRADGIIVTEDYRKSVGARNEHQWALDNDVPIFESVEELTMYHWC